MSSSIFFFFFLWQHREINKCFSCSTSAKSIFRATIRLYLFLSYSSSSQGHRNLYHGQRCHLSGYSDQSEAYHWLVEVIFHITTPFFITLAILNQNWHHITLVHCGQSVYTIYSRLFKLLILVIIKCNNNSSDKLELIKKIVCGSSKTMLIFWGMALVCTAVKDMKQKDKLMQFASISENPLSMKKRKITLSKMYD